MKPPNDRAPLDPPSEARFFLEPRTDEASGRSVNAVAQIGKGSKPRRRVLPAVTDWPAKTTDRDLMPHSRCIGVSVDVLRAVGCFTLAGCLAVPMRRATGAVCGVQLLALNGSQWIVPGSRPGLFGILPLRPGRLVVAESAIDTLVALNVGLKNVVGRPSGRCARDTIQVLARGRPVVLIADADSSGASGENSSIELADELRLASADVRVVWPSLFYMDLRTWRSAGASLSEIEDAIAATPPFDLVVGANPTVEGPA